MKVESRTSMVTGLSGVYRRFFVVALPVAASLAILGTLPTRKLVGAEAVPAMALAIGVAFGASLVGTVPIYLARHRSPIEVMPAQFGAMALRLAVALVVGAAIAFSGLVDARPFLLWLVLAHAGLLIADTLFARAVVAASAERHALGNPEAHSR